MKHIGLLVFVVWLARLAAGEDGQDDDADHQLNVLHEDAKISCRVAVCLSGDVRSFVSPAVHLPVRRNVIEAIEESGCRVDVFAYAALEDTGTLVEQEENSGYAPNMGEVEASMEILAPTRLVWHQEQAGIIPNSCPETLYWDNSAKSSATQAESGSTSADDWMRKNRDEDTPNLYWQLYMSRAAYRMALEEESEEKFVYDWIVHTRFDATWTRPIPPLSLFSREAVWLDANSWPASDDFALVPRAHSDHFFSALSTFYACDEYSSWPPAEPWWNPHCDGKGFGESVLFRYLHASGVDYRTYPMFDYVPTLHGQSGKHCDTRKSAYYTSVCVLLDTWDLLAASFSGADCTTTLSEWSDLRCETLMSSAGMGEQRRAEAVLHPDPRAWEQLLPTLAMDGSGEADTQDAPFPENLRLLHVKLAALRDSVLLFPSAVEETSLSTLESPQSKRDRWEMGPAWLIHSQDGCRIEEHAGRAPHLVRYYVVDPSLAEEMALAMKCLAHRLVEGTGAGGADFDASVCAHVRPLELVMIDVSARSAELGVCTADSSLEVSAAEHVQRFFADPVAHCVGYGRMLFRQSPSTAGGGTGEGAEATVDDSVTEPLTRPSEEGAIIYGAPVTGAEVLEAGEISSPTTEVVDAVVAALEPSSEGVSVSRVLREYSLAMASVEGLDSWEGDERSIKTSTTSAACSDLMVQAMTVVHPAEGAVYWEGPVTVQLEVTLTGPGLRGLDPKDVHICADTEEAWPILDWSRSCISLDQLASPDFPFLVFGSTIGVVVGSVSVRDARPACIPEGSLRGPVLPMEGGGDGEIASERVRFKVIHHKSTLERRGRPLGPSPLGRGFATTEEYIQDLEREADEEASVALDEMQSYVNLTHGLNIELRGERCQSKLQIHQRGTSLIASSFQLRFLVEQLDWMLASGKLPSEMVVAADRMKELQQMLLDETTPSDFSMVILSGAWRSVAPFFQKTLLLPAPELERVVSTTPLHTWEYDEVPWMEALNPEVDWNAVEQAYLGNTPVELAYVDNFFSPKALAVLLDMAYGSTFFFDHRQNYIGAYPSDGMSHPLLYQVAEEAAERLPRIVGRGTPGWPLVQSWIYIYGGNDGERCDSGIKVHADTAMVNLNVWLAPDSANLGSAETDDGGGLTVFHAKPPTDWSFEEFNRDPKSVMDFLEENDAGNTSTPHRQNRALLFDSMLFHQSDPFRFKKGFDNKRINLTLLFGPQKKPAKDGEPGTADAAAAEPLHRASSDNWYSDPESMREVPPERAGALLYCL